MKRARNFTITAAARRDWENLLVQGSIQDLVDAFFELPDAAVREAHVPQPHRDDCHIAHARIGGRLFMLGGCRNANGESRRVEIAGPVWPPPITDEGA